MYFKPQIKKSKIIIANPKLKHKNSNSSILKHKCTNSNYGLHPQKNHNKSGAGLILSLEKYLISLVYHSKYTSRCQRRPHIRNKCTSALAQRKNSPCDERLIFAARTGGACQNPDGAAPPFCVSVKACLKAAKKKEETPRICSVSSFYVLTCRGKSISRLVLAEGFEPPTPSM